MGHEGHDRGEREPSALDPLEKLEGGNRQARPRIVTPKCGKDGSRNHT